MLVFNNFNTLPQQVEENTENIKKLEEGLMQSTSPTIRSGESFKIPLNSLIVFSPVVMAQMISLIYVNGALVSPIICDRSNITLVSVTPTTITVISSEGAPAAVPKIRQYNYTASPGQTYLTFENVGGDTTALIIY